MVDAGGRLTTFVVTPGETAVPGSDVGTTTFVTTGPLVVTRASGAAVGAGAEVAKEGVDTGAAAMTFVTGVVVGADVGMTTEAVALLAAGAGRESKLRERFLLRKTLSSSARETSETVGRGSVFATAGLGTFGTGPVVVGGVHAALGGTTAAACNGRGDVVGPLSPEHDGVAALGPFPVM